MLSVNSVELSSANLNNILYSTEVLLSKELHICCNLHISKRKAILTIPFVSSNRAVVLQENKHHHTCTTYYLYEDIFYIELQIVL